MSGLFVSVVRTVVPVVAGTVISAGAAVGLDLDDGQVTAAATAVVTAVYYTAFRGLEEWAGRMGVPWLRRLAGSLLGWARPPQYPDPPRRDLGPALRAGK